MKSYRSLNLLAVTTAVILSFALALPGTAQQRRASGRVGAGNGSYNGGINTLFSAIEKGPLSTDDIDGLTFMREEEKLARDVYLTLADKWQLPIYSNIAGAEQRHMDAVQMVFTTYENEINDPGFDNTVGAFANNELAALYLQLVEKGNLSLVDALTVGATIEDLDLKDLEIRLTTTTNDHVKLVYNNLAKGSRNHLRAFMRALTAQGGTYSPDHIDQAAFDAILGSEMERRVVYGADGEALATGCGGRGGQGRRGQGQGQGQGRGNRGGSGAGKCDGSGPQDGGQAGGPNS